MPVIEFADFPEEERLDFEHVCATFGLNPAMYTITAVKPIQTALGRRIVFVRLSGSHVGGPVLELSGATWVSNFAAQSNKLTLG